MAINFTLQLLLTILIIRYHLSILDFMKFVNPTLKSEFMPSTIERREMHRRFVKEFIVVISLSNAVVNIIVFIFGLYAIYSKVLTNLQVFQVLLMISILFDVLLAYLTIVNVFILIIKCVLMFASRNLITSLLTILILPLGQ